MAGAAALPRDNGEIAFAAPWEGRAVALALALVERLGLSWDEFRQQLIAAISEMPERPYYESWAVALERLMLAQHLTTREELDRAEPTERPVL